MAGVSTTRGTAHLPGAAQGTMHLNAYDNGRVICTSADRRKTELLGGQAWNVVNMRNEHRNRGRKFRNNDHFVDGAGEPTKMWFEKRKHVVHASGVLADQHCFGSSQAQDILTCPPTAGKTAARLRDRETRQRLQASAPGDFGLYDTRKRDLGHQTPRVREEKQSNDPVTCELTCKYDHAQWMARKASNDLWKTGCHADANPQISCAKPHEVHPRPFSTPKQSILAAAGGTDRRERRRCKVPSEQTSPPRRVEPSPGVREITGWHLNLDKSKREDAYYRMPKQQIGSPSVKFDILSQARRSFWN